MGARRAVAALVVLLELAATGARAQHGDAGADADSVALVAEARKAQAAFERSRQVRLPWTFGTGSGRCDEIVGRYCVRHDRSDDEWVPPPEHHEITERRDALLALLRKTARLLPGDRWITGQRVWYQLDAGRTGDAAATARSCAAERWWCAALEGLVHHERGHTEAAERSFAAALAAMPPDERARWTDPRPILGDRGRRFYDGLPESARDSVTATLWWLADPLWMRAGNDRLTEQYARRVRASIAAEARQPDGAIWRWDLEELLLRLGAPTGWERRSSGSIDRGAQIVTHRAPFGREFLPALRGAVSPFTVDDDAWELTPHVPVTEYAPGYARFEGEVAHRLVVLPDGDSVTVAVVAAFRHDSVGAEAPVQVALVLAANDWVAVDSSAGTARRAVRAVHLPLRDVVASVEAIASAGVDRAARARFGLPLALRDSLPIALSDPLLLIAGPPPISRREAIDRLLLPRGESELDSVTVYFEAQRLAPDVPVEVEVTLEPRAGRGGTLRRLGESVGLLAPRTAVRLAWEEPPPAAGRLTRAVTLGFSGVPSGEYALLIRLRQGSARGASWTLVHR